MRKERSGGYFCVYEDNNGCIGQADGTKGMKRARHYLVSLAALNEAVHSTEIHMQRVDSNDNPADSFTKPNGGPTHVYLSTKTVGYNMNFSVKTGTRHAIMPALLN